MQFANGMLRGDGSANIGKSMIHSMLEAVAEVRSGSSFAFGLSAEIITGARNVDGLGDSPGVIEGSHSFAQVPMWVFTCTISDHLVKVAPIVRRISKLCVSTVTKWRPVDA